MVFSTGLFQLRDSSLVNISVTRAREMISTTLSQPNNHQRLLASSVRLSLLTAPEKKEYELETTVTVASGTFSE